MDMDEEIFIICSELRDCLMRDLPFLSQTVSIDDIFLECQKDLYKTYFMPCYLSRINKGNFSKSYVRFIKKSMRARVKNLEVFCKKIHFITSKLQGVFYNVKFLDGDSHNKAHRPVLLISGKDKYVLKFTDPRNFIIYLQTLSFVVKRMELELFLPEINYDTSFSWQIVPFMESNTGKKTTEDEKRRFFYLIGVNISIAYALVMTDLHFENIITSDNTPYIIDTECLLYNFNNKIYTPQVRLLMSGLISAELMTAGVTAGNENVIMLGYGIDEKIGRPVYSRTINKFDNRLLNEKGEVIDNYDYIKFIMSGFKNSYEIIYNHKKELQRLLENITRNGLMTRLLIRTTLHYRITQDMLFNPLKQDHFFYLKQIKEKFFKSGALFEDLSNKVMSIEINDMQNGDIPFFTLCENGIYNDNKLVMERCFSNVSNRIHDALNTFNLDDLTLLMRMVEKYIRRSSSYGGK